MLECATHRREVVERGKCGGDLDRKSGKPRRACDDAEHHSRGVGTEVDRPPPQWVGVARVIATLDEHIVLSNLVRSLDIVDDPDEIIESDGLFVERDDDTSKDWIHLRPMHTLDRAQPSFERGDQRFRTRPMHATRLNVRTTRRRPHVTPARPSTRAIDPTRQDRRHLADRIQW